MINLLIKIDFYKKLKEFNKCKKKLLKNVWKNAKIFKEEI